MRIDDAAKELDVNVPTVHEWADLGLLDRTRYFGDYFISDESVRKFRRSIDRMDIQKQKRLQRTYKAPESATPDYFVRVDEVAAILDIPVHQARTLAQSGVFDARKVEGRWVMDGGQAHVFVLEHNDNGKRYHTAADIMAQLREDNRG